MEITLLLARIFGPYFLLAAVMVFLNRKELMVNVEAMYQERFAQWLAGMIATLGGIAYINIYQDWSSFTSGLLSMLGWLVLIKGLLYAFIPRVRLAKLTGILDERSWYTMDGILAFLCGLYLTAYGYGIL